MSQPTSPSCTPLTDSVKLPAVPSIAAEDPYGLFTKSLPEGIRIKSSTEAAIKPETRCSSAKHAAGHETLCTNSQVGNTIYEVPSQPELTKSASKVDNPVTSDVTRQANKAAKKARQRAAKYGSEKLLLGQSMPEKQVAFKKDPTDSMQLLAKSPTDGTQIKSSIAEAAPQSSIAEAALKTSEEAALKSSKETALKSSEEERANHLVLGESSPPAPRMSSVSYPTPTPPQETSSSQSCTPQRKSFSEWRATWQLGLNWASVECRDSRELKELLDIFFSITTESEYLSLKPNKFGRVTIKTLNMHYRQLMIALFKQNEAGKMGEEQIKSFSEEFIGWQDPTKLTKPTPP